MFLELQQLWQYGQLHVERWVGHYALQKIHRSIPRLRLAVYQELS